MKNFILKIFLFIILLWGSQAIYAQKMAIPARIQIATFTKVFKYANQLKDKTTIKLLIVYDKNSRIEKDEFVLALKKTEIDTYTATSDRIPQQIEKVDVVYFMPGLQNKAEICKRIKKLSIAGIAKYAINGDVSIAVDLEENHPRLFINMASLDKEAHQVSAKLLKISKVYR